MDHATMSYAQLLQAYQALQEHVIALEGAAAVQQRVPGLRARGATHGPHTPDGHRPGSLPGGRRRDGRADSRARLGADAARPRGDVAAEPQERGQHPAAVAGADRPLLGLRSSSRSTTTPMRRCSARSIRGRSVGPRASAGARCGTSSARCSRAWSGRVRRSGRRTTPSSSTGRGSSKRRTSTSRTTRSASRTAASAASSASSASRPGASSANAACGP